MSPHKSRAGSRLSVLPWLPAFFASGAPADTASGGRDGGSIFAEPPVSASTRKFAVQAALTDEKGASMSKKKSDCCK